MKKRLLTRKRLLQLISALSVVAFFAAWQIIVDFEIVPNELLATPLQVWKLLIVKLYNPNPDGALLTTHIWVSVQEALLGYLLRLA
ncbi:MAG TPA: ABC transporter permease, partial [Syntrophobacteraceae bacterium]|nr:ABC transporter permease [Syntrophobacteraceae bacterium]